MRSRPKVPHRHLVSPRGSRGPAHLVRPRTPRTPHSDLCPTSQKSTVRPHSGRRTRSRHCDRTSRTSHPIQLIRSPLLVSVRTPGRRTPPAACAPHTVTSTQAPRVGMVLVGKRRRRGPLTHNLSLTLLTPRSFARLTASSSCTPTPHRTTTRLTQLPLRDCDVPPSIPLLLLAIPDCTVCTAKTAAPTNEAIHLATHAFARALTHGSSLEESFR